MYLYFVNEFDDLKGDTPEGYINIGQRQREALLSDLAAAELSLGEVEFVVYDTTSKDLVHVAEFYKREYRPNAQERINGVIVNPKQRYYFNLTEMPLRPTLEVLDWADLPYVVYTDTNCEVYCLDGGSSDRPTCLGQFENVGKAIEYVRGLAGECSKCQEGL